MSENNTLLEKLDGLVARFEEVSTLITDPSVIADQKRYVKLTKEYKELGDLIKVRKEYLQCLNGLEEAKIMMSESDPELKEMAREEIAACEARIPELEEEIKLLLIPADPQDDRNAILEIRGGTGGDEGFQSRVFQRAVDPLHIIQHVRKRFVHGEDVKFRESGLLIFRVECFRQALDFLKKRFRRHFDLSFHRRFSHVLPVELRRERPQRDQARRGEPCFPPFVLEKFKIRNVKTSAVSGRVVDVKRRRTGEAVVLHSAEIVHGSLFQPCRIISVFTSFFQLPDPVGIRCDVFPRIARKAERKNLYCIGKH